MKRLKKGLLIGACTLGLSLGIAIITFRAYQAENLPQAKTNLEFIHAKLDFIHEFDAKAMLPFLGSAAFDANGDGQVDLFLGGGLDQADSLFTYENGTFQALNIEFEKSDNAATHGAAHLDVDNDGDVDLFLARSTGVTFFKNENGRFEQSIAHFPMAENSIPLSIALGDINADGQVDLYISGYIALDAVEGETIFAPHYGAYSKLYLGSGENKWTDATSEYGLDEQHNRFTAGFVDLDKDRDQDLVIAQDTGVIETWRNLSGGSLERIPNPSVSSYPMGLGFGDINNDGSVDIWSSNVGHTLPGALLRGDLPKNAPFNTNYYLLANDGSGTFSDVAKLTGVARLGFGWGTVIEDMDLDGREDLLAAQNYARLPGNGILRSYPGKLLLQQMNGTFADATRVAPDKGFGIAPLVADFNSDGAPDLVWANLAGPSRAWISAGGTGNSVVIKLPNQTAFLGATAVLTDSEGRRQTKHIIAGEGLGSDMGRKLIFGLGSSTLDNVVVTLQNGESRTFNKAINGVISWQR